MKNKKYLFIINPKSGFTKRGKTLFQTLENNIQQFPGEVKLVKSEYKGQGLELAKKAVKDKIDVVVAVGGDGTVNDVASGLVWSDVHFGVIPAGSGNGFARNYGIPLQNKKAIELLKHYKVPKIIDCGKINGMFFFNVAGIGVDAVIAEEFDNLGVRGLFAYFGIGLKAFLKYSFPEIILNNGTGEKKLSPYSIVLANGKQFGGNAIIAPKASCTDGLLDLVVYPKRSIFGVAVDAVKFFTGTLNKAKHVKFSKFFSLNITIEENMTVHIDGEPVKFGRELYVQIVPAALKVISED